ncbi:hypothetical protein EHQ68_14020 [Leptospira congkakensis]|uniref:Uncharacterized protein n=1 Tax=Leptospira congkakensis TaxID=2484932 RepID=A0A8B5NB46_9LEPT|nr:hypothetical protein [Leptospira congkakensis]TGL86435.1 hypothetical protein EHQ68_14020 [Leptospira congkakensis]TGL94019.1 hypothetical protein EHQ69_06010 [Leptospira congkakensis]
MNVIFKSKKESKPLFQQDQAKISPSKHAKPAILPTQPILNLKLKLGLSKKGHHKENNIH